MQKFLSRSTRHLLLLSFEIIAALVAVVLLAWGGLLLRLDQGPIDLSAIRGPLQKTLNSNIKDYDIKFDDVQLGWGGVRTPLELQMTDVGVFDKNTNMILAGISQVGLELSKSAFMTGEIAPSAINFYNIGLRVFYDPEQGIALSLDHENDTDSQVNVLENLRRAVEKKSSENDAASKLRHLQTARIIDADVLLQSQNFADDVILKDARIVMKRNDRQLTATLDGIMHVRDNNTPLLGHIYFNPDAKTNIASLHFSDLEVKDVKSLISEEWRQRLTVEGVFKGTTHIGFNNEFQPDNVRFEVNVSNGQFNFDDFFVAPIAFENLGMNSTFDFSTREMKLEDVRIQNGELDVKLSGTSKTLDENGGQQISLETELTNLPVNDIGSYWPQNVLPLARKWVSDNIRQGLVTSAKQKLDITKKSGERDTVDIQTLEGEIHFEKADVTYLDGFPAVQNVSGTALFDPSRFVIDIDGGLYRDTKLTPSKITIDGFDAQPKIEIDLNIQTNLTDALNILDSEPYRFTSKFDLDPARMRGNAAVGLNFKFPLIEDLQESDVTYTASASSYDFAWQDIFQKFDLSDTNVELELTKTNLNAKGNGMLSGAPVTFDMKQYFDTDGLSSSLNAQTVVDVQDVGKDYIADSMSVRGQVPVTVSRKTYRDGDAVVDVRVDLQPAAFDIKNLEIMKPAGVSGTADFRLAFSGDRLTSIENINVATPPLSFKGNVGFTYRAGTAQWNRADLRDLSFGENRVSSLNAENLDDALSVKVAGEYFDVASYLKADDGNVTPQNTKPLRLSGDMKRLITSENGGLYNAKIFLSKNNRNLTDRLELDGTAGRGQIYLRYKPDENGLQTLRVEADDAGAALAALGYTQSVRGGILVIDGRPVGRGQPRDMAGRFQISNFKVVDAPVLARLLNGMSVTGLSALLQGDGMDFSRLSSEFKWQDKTSRQMNGGLLRILNGTTAGASLGLTFDGQLDMAQKNIDLQGNLVPVSNLNTAFSGIPVLGDILTGGGDGVFAATYTVKGDIKSPVTTVNPLAALAPGVLRTIFFENGQE